MKTIFKWIIGILVALLVIVGGVIYALSTDKVQQWLYAQGVDVLQDALGTRVKVDKIAISFSKGGIALYGLEIDDKQNVTMLKVDTLEAMVDLTRIFDHKVEIEERNEFVADNPSSGRNVTVETTASFNSVAEEEQYFEDVKAAVRIGTNACFQVFTANGGKRVWLDTEGFTPTVGNEYAIRVEMDMTNKTYTVEVKNANNEYVKLSSGGTTRFPFAYADTAPYLQKVGYVGEGAVESIFGSYTSKIVEFCVNDVVRGRDADNAPLTAAQAAWLNAFPAGYDAVASRIGALSVRQFSDAYLLNLDLMQDGFGYGFDITGIAAANGSVTVDVTLTRTNALATAGINGTLGLYGGETPGGITNFLDQAEFGDATFSKGNATQAAFPQDGTNTFFKAVIEAR